MATAITSPPCVPNSFDLRFYSPPNLAQGASAAPLRDSSPAEITDIGVSPASYRTPRSSSSPLNRTSNPAITEGQQLLDLPALPTSVTHKRQQPVNITEAATRIANEQITVTSNFENHVGYAIRAHVAGIELSRILCTSNRHLLLHIARGKSSK